LTASTVQFAEVTAYPYEMPFFFDAAMSNPCEDVNTVSASVTSVWRPHPPVLVSFEVSTAVDSPPGFPPSPLSETRRRGSDSCREKVGRSRG